MTTSSLDALLENNKLPGWRLLAWPVMILITSLIVWANYARLDEVAVATGEVIPVGDVKTIQHLEGGIVKKIFVTDGSNVKKGDPLLLLNLATAGVNRDELQVRLDSQLLLRARLEAEAKGEKAPVFPKDAARRRPAQLRAQIQSYRARRRQLASTINVLVQALNQRQQDVKELEARYRSVSKNLILGKKRLALSNSLLAEGLTAKIDHLQLQAEVEGLSGDAQGLVSSISRAKSAISEAKARIVEEQDRFRSDSRQKLAKAEQKIGQIQELLVSATEQDTRALIHSPINGIVQNLKNNTIGGIVRPGEPIMEIVPTGTKLVIDARLNPVDRGFVTIGQSVVVKLSTYDFSRFGGLRGKVVMVAPDTSMDEKGKPYFKVLVEVKKNYLGDNPNMYKIKPGMRATIDIHTGHRSFMEFLLKPIFNLKDEAFRER